MRKRDSEIARRYAVAVFELAKEQSKLVDVLAEFRKAAKYFFVVEDLLTNLSIADEDKISALQVFIEVLELSTLAKNSLKLMLQNKRLKLFPIFMQELQDSIDDHMGICRADLIAARPVEPEILSEFENLLSQKFGKKVFLAQKLDEGMIAGYVVKVGTTVIDASLRTRIKQFSETLTRGV